jgi:hypothetical protein
MDVTEAKDLRYLTGTHSHGACSTDVCGAEPGVGQANHPEGESS